MLGFSDGVVKVGRTSNPHTRMITLRSEARVRGATIDRVWVSAHSDPRGAEWHLRLVGSHFKRFRGTEYFKADFDKFMRKLESKFAQWGVDLGEPVEAFAVVPSSSPVGGE